MNAFDILPHRPPMLLLEDVIAHDADKVTATLTIAEHSRFFAAGKGVPAYVGLEYMAQACGAYAGALGRTAGEEPKIGYLLGTRDFESSVAFFPEGARLSVTALVLYRDAELGSFQCQIAIGDKVVASARLAVFQPDRVALHG